MKNKAIITFILIAVMVLSTTVALATTWSATSGTIGTSYGWQILTGGFTGAFGVDGVHSTNAQYSNGAHPVNVSSNGNFDLTIQFKLQGDLNKTAFVGISTLAAPATQSGWMVIGNTRNGSFRVSSTGSDVLGGRTLGTALPTLGTTYTAHIVSTDGGHTATFSVDGYGTPLTINLPASPKYVIVHLGNNGTTNPSISNVPCVMSINFNSPDPTPTGSVTPTPTPSATPNPNATHLNYDLQGIRDFYANQPIVHMSNQSVVYNPDGTVKQVLTGTTAGATPTPSVKPTVSVAPTVTVNPSVTAPTATPIVTVAPTKTQSPGFEMILAAIGMVAALVLITRKKK